MTGVYTDNQPDFTWLKPYEEKTFTQYFLPYHQVGSVSNASLKAVLGLEKGIEEVVVHLYVPQSLTGARLIVSSEDKELMSEPVDLATAQNKQWTLACAAESMLSVRLVDSGGAQILVFSEQQQGETELPERQSLHSNPRISQAVKSCGLLHSIWSSIVMLPSQLTRTIWKGSLAILLTAGSATPMAWC